MKKGNEPDAVVVPDNDEDMPDAINNTAFEPYESMLKHEEEEVLRRSEEEDKIMYMEICNKIQYSMEEIKKLKIDKPEQWANCVEEKKVKVLMLMLSLRKLSRTQKVRVKDSRDMTAETRQRVDGATLQLQNLLYEVSHLKKEVRKCLEFQSADKEIDLIPIDQFYMEAPENISRPKETVEDPHQQRLAQLHWELEQRRGQTQLFDKLTQEKEKVADIISTQEAKLASLAPRINTILEATLPLQNALGLPLEAQRDQQRVSSLLPAPLYTLWVQATAYGEACDSLLSAQIEGDVEAAKKLIIVEDEPKTEASDSENEMDGQEENVTRKSRGRHSEKKIPDPSEVENDAVKNLMILHPLHVLLTLKMKDGSSVQIKFCYAQTLRVVTTFCTLDLVSSPKPILTDILNGDNFLNKLYPGDTGLVSPNPANEYQLQKIGMTNLSLEHIKLIGRPYIWAQTLSGLSFLTRVIEPVIDINDTVKIDVSDDTDAEDVTEDEEHVAASLVAPVTSQPTKQVSETLSWKLSAEHMHHTISGIRKRLQARLSLHVQLRSLEVAKSIMGIPLSPEIIVQRFPGKVSSEFISWKPISWNEYESTPSSEPIINCGVVDSDFLTFKAVFERQTVRLEALVAISPDYPNSQPLFSLTLLWNKPQIALTNPHIRQMESEVNVHYHELVSNRNERCLLLSLQLYRLAMCLDILTEATCIQVDQSSSEKQFHKEKIFFRPARGPDRALPLKYLPKLGVFAQR